VEFLQLFLTIKRIRDRRMKFEVGDLVSMAGNHSLARYTGHIVAIEMDAQGCLVRLDQTGLIHGFTMTEIELIERANKAKAQTPTDYWPTVEKRRPHTSPRRARASGAHRQGR
jgi:hypothetical protein